MIREFEISALEKQETVKGLWALDSARRFLAEHFPGFEIFPIQWEQPCKKDGFICNVWSGTAHKAEESIRVWIYERIGTWE